MASINQILKVNERKSILLHFLVRLIIPIVLLIMVRGDFVLESFILVLLAKWRVFAVKSRYWLAMIRSNAVDSLVGFSYIMLLSISSGYKQALLLLGYSVWVIVIKPLSTKLQVSLQALIAYLVSLISVAVYYPKSSQMFIAVSLWILTYFCARHFFSKMDEEFGRQYSHILAFLMSFIGYSISKWMVYYSVVPMYVYLISVIMMYFGTIYILNDVKPSGYKMFKTQASVTLVLAVLVMIVLTNWDGVKII